MKKLLLFLICFVGSYIASAQVQVDNTTSADDNDVSSVSLSHTINSANSNRLLMVGISTKEKNQDPTDVSVTYQTQTLTLLAEQANNNKGDKNDGQAFVFYLKNPPTGSGNVVVTFNNTQEKGVVVGATSFYDVEQTSTFGSVAQAGDDNTNPSVSVTSSSGDLIYDMLSYKKSGTVTPGAGQVKEFDRRNDEMRGASSLETATGPSTTMSWTGDNEKWGLIAVAIKPVLCPVSATVSSTNINTTCGNNTGSITISNPTGASNGNYQYSIDNFSTFNTTGSFTSLNANTLFAVVNYGGSVSGNEVPLSYINLGNEITVSGEGDVNNNISTSITRVDDVSCDPFPAITVKVSNSGQLCDNELIYFVEICNTGSQDANLDPNTDIVEYAPADFTLIDRQLEGNNPFVGTLLPAGERAVYEYAYNLDNAVNGTSYNYSVDVNAVAVNP